MTFPLIPVVDALCIAHMQGLEHLLQTVLCARDCDEMDVIRHQTVRQYLKLVLLAVVMKPFQISLVIFHAIKDIFSAVAPLSDVMWHLDTNGSNKTGPPHYL